MAMDFVHCAANLRMQNYRASTLKGEKKKRKEKEKRKKSF